MKKLVSLMMLVVLLISLIPLAVAQEGTQDGPRKRIRQNIEEAREDVQALREARQRFREQRAALREQREEIRDLRKSLRDCEGEECEALRAQIYSQAQDFLQQVADDVLAALSRLRERIERSAMSEDQKAEMLAKIDERVAAVEAALTEMEELEEDATPEQIRRAAARIRGVWKETKPVLQQQVGRVITHRFAGIIQRAEHLESKLQQRIDRFEADGHDVSGLESLLADFSSHIDSAKALLDETVELFNAGERQAAQEKLRAAKDALKEAHGVLKEIVQNMRELRQAAQETSDDEEDQEIEIEVEFGDGEVKVEIERNGEEEEYTLDTTDEEEILAFIMEKTGLTREEILDIWEFETEEDDEEDEEDDDEADEDTA